MDSRSKVLLSLQRALLGEVVKDLRGVAVDVREQLVTIEYYFARGGASDYEDVAGTVTTEVAADLPHDWQIEDAVIVQQPSERMPDGRTWAFRRHE